MSRLGVCAFVRRGSPVCSSSRIGLLAIARTFQLPRGRFLAEAPKRPSLFMVIQRFRNQDAKAVYRRFEQRGRLAPDGVTYVGSWVEASLDRCFQLMECDDVTLLQQWVAQWSDLVSFEIVPVVSGKDTAAALSSL
jgi:hypothetical protein